LILTALAITHTIFILQIMKSYNRHYNFSSKNVTVELF